MRVSFHSSHVDGDFRGGRLTVRVTIDDDARQFTETREIFFSVPPDFHAHNDLVAAALMAIMGRGFDVARFNFPVSSRCAAALPRYHQLADVGPVDTALEPRRPGHYLGIAFSGGLDSLAVLTMLREAADLDVKVITAEYDGFYREAVGYAPYQRDVSCWTNFRRVFGDRGRRFDAAVPLLFADYADLRSFATGHQFGHYPALWVDPRSDEPPEYLPQDTVAEAGGLQEVHVARCFHTPGLLKFLVAAAPERIELGLHASAAPRNDKYLTKALMLRRAYHDLWLELPPYLADIVWELRRPVSGSIYLWMIWEWRFLDPASARRIDPRIDGVDWSPLRDCSLACFWRYCPHTAARLPEEMRPALLAGLHAHGIEPYTALDYEELEQVRQFVLAVNPPGSITFD